MNGVSSIVNNQNFKIYVQNCSLNHSKKLQSRKNYVISKIKCQYIQLNQTKMQDLGRSFQFKCVYCVIWSICSHLLHPTLLVYCYVMALCTLPELLDSTFLFSNLLFWIYRPASEASRGVY